MAHIYTSLGSRLYEDFAWARIFSAFCPVSFLISLSGHRSTPRKRFHPVPYCKGKTSVSDPYTESRSRSFAESGAGPRLLLIPDPDQDFICNI
jgi:hypothetical protein